MTPESSSPTAHAPVRLLAQAGTILDLSIDYEATLPTLARLVANGIGGLCVIRVLPDNGRNGFTASAHEDAHDHARLAAVVPALEDDPPDDSITGAVLRSGEPTLLDDLDGAGTASDSSAPLAVLGRALGLEAAAIFPIRARAETLGYMILGRSDAGFSDDALRTGDELARRIGIVIDHARLYESEQLARRAKDDFLAIISHELRTPLTAILGYADLLEAEVSGPLNEQQHRQVQRIHAGTNRLHGVLESILAYVRLESGQDEPRLQSVVLEDVLDRVRSVIEPRALDDGVAFRMETNGMPPRIVTDPDWLLQIILALVTNALKFTQQGEVVVRVEREVDSLIIEVRDSGPGIPVDAQPYVFSPFWQAEQPTTRRAGGAGLGLSVARRLARLLDGDVTIAASSPEGTTFRFRAPTAAGQ